MIDEMDKQLARRAGFVVGEDPDQPGRYQWSRQECGRTVDGCESSFKQESQAWKEAVAMTLAACLDEGNLTAHTWRTLSQEQKLAIVAQVFS